jgi:periplasmic divalent cation tolerance protein
MAAESSYCVVITTTATREDAEVIARQLLAEKLAACVQVSAIESSYTWNSTIVRENELILHIKTRANLYEKVEEAIRAHHKYEVPEIIQLPIMAGAPPANPSNIQGSSPGSAAEAMGVWQHTYDGNDHDDRSSKFVPRLEER